MGRRMEALRRHDRVKYSPRPQFIGAAVCFIGAMLLLLVEGGPSQMLLTAFTVLLICTSLLYLVRGITAVMDTEPERARDTEDVFD